MKTISNIHGRMVRISEPTEFVGCSQLVIFPTIIGGKTCLTLTECKDCEIDGGWLRNPAGPNDPFGHCLLLDKCHNISVDDVDMRSEKPSGDKLCIYKSSNISVTNCDISGPNANDAQDIGAAICIDDGSEGVQVNGNTLCGPGPVGISVASGVSHSIDGNRITGFACGIQIGGSYPKQPVPQATVAKTNRYKRCGQNLTNCTFIGNSIGTNTGTGCNLTNCTFIWNGIGTNTGTGHNLTNCTFIGNSISDVIRAWNTASGDLIKWGWSAFCFVTWMHWFWR